MPNLCQISINSEVKHFLEEVQYKSFENIRKLEIGNCYTGDDDDEDDSNYSIEQLGSVFPRIEHLHITHLCSMTQILDFINHFKYLSSGSFYYIPWYATEESIAKNIIEIQSGLDQCRSSNQLDFTISIE